MDYKHKGCANKRVKIKRLNKRIVNKTIKKTGGNLYVEG